MSTTSHSLIRGDLHERLTSRSGRRRDARWVAQPGAGGRRRCSSRWPSWRAASACSPTRRTCCARRSSSRSTPATRSAGPIAPPKNIVIVAVDGQTLQARSTSTTGRIRVALRRAGARKHPPRRRQADRRSTCSTRRARGPGGSPAKTKRSRRGGRRSARQNCARDHAVGPHGETADTSARAPRTLRSIGSNPRARSCCSTATGRSRRTRAGPTGSEPRRRRVTRSRAAQEGPAIRIRPRRGCRSTSPAAPGSFRRSPSPRSTRASTRPNEFRGKTVMLGATGLGAAGRPHDCDERLVGDGGARNLGERRRDARAGQTAAARARAGWTSCWSA